MPIDLIDVVLSEQFLSPGTSLSAVYRRMTRLHHAVPLPRRKSIPGSLIIPSHVTQHGVFLQQCTPFASLPILKSSARVR